MNPFQLFPNPFYPPQSSTELPSVEIQNRLNQLIDEHKMLNLGPYLHLIAPTTIELKLSLCSNDQTYKEMTPLQHLKETFLALERFDFSGVKQLSITLSGFEGNSIERSIYSSIQQSLSLLTTKCSIVITEYTFKNIEWNPYSFHQFTSFPIECYAFRYFYKLMSENFAIQATQQTIQGKVIVKLDIVNLSKKGELCVNLTRLFKQLILIREKDQLYSNSIDEETHQKSNKEESLDSNNSTQNSKIDEKDYIINISDEESTSFEQIVSVSNILQYWNRYSTQISKIVLTIKQCQDLNQQSDLASFVGHSDFAGIEVFQKVHISFPSMRLNQLDFLFLFKGFTIILPQSPAELQTLLNKLKEVQLVNLGYFKVISNKIDSIIPICNFVRTHLNSLIKFEFQKTSFCIQSDLSFYLKQIVQLTETTNINMIDFSQQIIFQHNQLKIPWFSSLEKLGKISVVFPEIIGQFTKAFSLELQFNYINYPARSEKSELILLMHKLLEFRHVTEISILDEVMIEFPDIHEIINHRKSIYHSLVAYDKFIKTKMLYHPGNILFDLFEDIN